MPKGVPVATVAIDNATNAGLHAISILAIADNDLLSRFHFFPHSLHFSLYLLTML